MTAALARTGHFTIKSIAQARALADERSKMADRAKAALTRLHEENKAAIGQFVQTCEVAGAAGLAGFVNGKFGENGELKLGGIPVDLGVACALHALGYMDGLGKHARHGHNVGDGALAAYVYRLGVRFGAQSESIASAPKKTAAAGLPAGHRVHEMNVVGAGREYEVEER